MWNEGQKRKKANLKLIMLTLLLNSRWKTLLHCSENNGKRGREWISEPSFDSPSNEIVMAELLECDLEVSEFELQTHYYVHL